MISVGAKQTGKILWVVRSGDIDGAAVYHGRTAGVGDIVVCDLVLETMQTNERKS